MDSLQPDLEREREKHKETGWNGLRQQHVWERSNLDAGQNQKAQKILCITFEILWRKSEIKLSEATAVHRLLQAGITAVRWNPHISGTLFKLGAREFMLLSDESWKGFMMPLGVQNMLKWWRNI